MNLASASDDRKGQASPLVSVIIIFLNAERFLAEAVESVRRQSLEQWELLLVDDGSGDGSTEIARSFCRADPRIRYLEHPGHANRGMSATRNLGLHNARGTFVAFIDSDDVWLPDKLAEQVRIAESSGADMVFGQPLYWRSWERSPSAADAVAESRLQHDRIYRPAELSFILYPLGNEPAPCPSDLLLRRDFVRRTGEFESHFSGPLQMYEDQAFLSKAYLTGHVYVSSSSWTRYRVHEDSCVSTVTREGRYEEVRKYFLSWFLDYLRSRQPRLRRLEMRVRDQLWQTLHPRTWGVLRRPVTMLRRAVRRLAPARR